MRICFARSAVMIFSTLLAPSAAHAARILFAPVAPYPLTRTVSVGGVQVKEKTMTKERFDEIRTLVKDTGNQHYKLSDARHDMSVLLDEVERLTRERDAAIEEIQGKCHYCSHAGDDDKRDCKLCLVGGKYIWQWRGVKEAGE